MGSPETYPQAGLGALLESVGGGGDAGLCLDPDGGVGAGFEGPAAVDGGGVGGDGAMHVDATLEGDVEDVGGGRESGGEDAGGENSGGEEGFGEHFV